MNPRASPGPVPPPRSGELTQVRIKTQAFKYRDDEGLYSFDFILDPNDNFTDEYSNMFYDSSGHYTLAAKDIVWPSVNLF